MKKKPIIVIFVFVFFVLSWVQFNFDVRSANLKGFEILMVKRERSVRALESMALTLTQTGRADIVEGHLLDAMSVGWIDFYMMTSGGEVVLFNSVRPLSDPSYATLIQIHPPDTFWEFRSSNESEGSIRSPASSVKSGQEEFKFFESDLGEGRRLKLGFNVNREVFLDEMNDYRSTENRRIFVLTLIVALAVFLFAARDLLKIVKTVRTKGVRGLRSLKVLSREAATLQTGLAGFGEAVDRLALANKRLSNQILPSLRSELQSGRQPPYEFECAMVRTDINNFTKTFHSYPKEEFLGVINTFFSECSHLVSRYKGYIHEFVGDEIIFYFKDEEHENAFVAALACCRDLESVAEKIHAETSVSPGYPFRVKSSVSHGRIRFGPLLNGFSLAGSPLIETTRILSAVTEKNENTIHFDSANVGRLNETVKFKESFRTVLKGIEGERTILRYVGHGPFSDLVEKSKNSDSNFARSVHAYRSDEDLVELLRQIDRNVNHKVSEEGLRLLGRIEVTKCEPIVVTQLLSTVESLYEQTLAVGMNANPEACRALAQLAIVLPRLIPQRHFGSDVGRSVHEALARLTEHPDPRVVANTIEALQQFREAGLVDRRLDDRLVNSSNTRVATNSLVYLGTNEISKSVLKNLTKRLDSKDINAVAAALFAWGEIAQYHLAHDPVYYRTQQDFLSISSRFERLAEGNRSLLEAASEAALKAGEVDLSKRLSARACATAA